MPRNHCLLTSVCDIIRENYQLTSIFMPRAKKAEPKADTKTSVEVVSGDEVVRVYSKKDHGSDFAELALQFAGKNGYIVR